MSNCLPLIHFHVRKSKRQSPALAKPVAHKSEFSSRALSVPPRRTVASFCLSLRIDPEGLRQMHQLLVEPLLSMIMILPRKRIISQQKTPLHRRIHHVNDGNLIRRKYLNSSQPSHDCHPLSRPPNLANRPEVYKTNFAHQQTAVSPDTCPFSALRSHCRLGRLVGP